MYFQETQIKFVAAGSPWSGTVSWSLLENDAMRILQWSSITANVLKMLYIIFAFHTN
jgi:hypothetical protein